MLKPISTRKMLDNQEKSQNQRQFGLRNAPRAYQRLRDFVWILY